MSIIVIGGQARGVGKTRVIAGLIQALRERSWTAIKITHHGHGLCPRHREPCDCVPDGPEGRFAITEESDR